MNNKSLLILFSYLTLSAGLASGQTDSLLDARDGKIYRTIKIGNQIWMAENKCAPCWCKRCLVQVLSEA